MTKIVPGPMNGSASGRYSHHRSSRRCSPRREEPQEIPELGMKRAILPLGDDGRFIEICEPLGEGAIENAMAKHGEGLHLVALGVDDLQTAKAEMEAKGARLIEAGKILA